MKILYLCRVMKLLMLLTVAGLVQVSAATYSQTITLKGNHLTLKEVFDAVFKQSGYRVAAAKSILNEAHVLSIDATNVPLATFLTQVLHGQRLSFLISDKDIILSRRYLPGPADTIRTSRAQPFYDEISGRLLNAGTKEPIAGATIRISSGTKMFISNGLGNFTLKDLPESAILSITCIGYEPLKISLSDVISPPAAPGTEKTQAPVEAVTASTPGEDSWEVPEASNGYIILLHPSNSELDQAQVIAYGTNTRRLSVGSVATVSAKDLENQPVSNLLLALEGKVPGLLVSPTSGAPGGAVQMQVRGQNSLQSSLSSSSKPYDQPLFIIDDVPFAPQNININLLNSMGGSTDNLNAYGGRSPFGSLNMADIASISILKDADATSIYGTQGANGVILITTKKGKQGKTTLDISLNTGLNMITRPVQMLNIQQYLDLRKEALANDGIDLSTASPQDYPDLLLFDQQKNTDWFGRLLGETASSTDLHASVSGGSQVTHFLISGGYVHQGYNFPGDYADNRLTLHSNIDHSSLDNRFLISFGTDVGYGRNNSSGVSNLSRSILTPPNYPELLSPDGSLVWNYQGVDLSNFQLYSSLMQSYALQTFNLNNSLHLSYTLMNGLKLSSNIGYSRFMTDEKQQNPAAAQNPQYASSSAMFATSTLQSINIEPQLDYQHTFGKGELSILLGGSYKKYITSNGQQQGYDYPSDAFLGSISAAQTIFASDTYLIHKYVAGFGRINYVYDQKYIVNLTGRRDGSSNFGPGRQFGNFGSAGLGWIFSEEKPFKSVLPVVSYGKLSANYGTNGSDGIAPYQYQAFWQPVTSVNPFQGIRPMRPVNLYNPIYGWDLKKSLNLAMDLGFWQNRLLLTASWYQDRTSSQLINYTLPSQTGFPSVLQNFDAVVQNRGLELNISSNNITSGNVTWSTTFNISGNRNTLLAFPGLATSPYATFYTLGKSVNIINGFRYKGVNPATGLFEYYNAAGEPTNTPTYGIASQGGDLQPIVDVTPKFFGGLGNHISYKKIDLFFQFQFSKQTAANYLASLYSQSIQPGGMINMPVEILNHWRQPGDVSAMQKVSSAYSDAYLAASNFLYSSGAYSDASYMRLKTVALSYSLPDRLLQKARLKNVKVYVNAQNLFTITGYKVGDPELPGGLFSFPLQRTIVCGFSLNL